MLGKGAAVVISAGKMSKAVTVQMVKEQWNRKLRKYFTERYNLLVSDPTSALREGDRITLVRERVSKEIRHTVHEMVAPFGVGLQDRPPILTADQRAEIKDTKRKAKVQRRASRGIESAIREAKERGWDVGFEDGPVTAMKGEHGTGQQHGRAVLPDGSHKFGKINDEAWRGSQRAMKRERKAVENEAEAEAVQQRPPEAAQREALSNQA